MPIRRDPTSTAHRRERLATAIACREQAAICLHLALVQLEAAIALMPASRDRLVMDRALRATLHAIRECTRTLRIARSQLTATSIPLSPTATPDAQLVAARRPSLPTNQQPLAIVRDAAWTPEQTD